MNRRAALHAVSFDAVGTLLFPEPSPFAVYAAMASDNGLSLPMPTIRERFLAAFQREEEIDRISGWTTNEARELVRWRAIVHSTLAGVRDAEACFQRLWAHYASPAAWHVNPDAVHVLEALSSRGVTLGMASNFDQRLRLVMEGHPALGLLSDRILISSEVGHRKPARAFFDELARLLGSEPAQILHVGDSPSNDYDGALASGFQAVLIGDDLQTLASQDCVRSLGELIDSDREGGSPRPALTRR